MDTHGNAGQPDPIRLLLAEDDPTNQYVFRAMLGTGGYDVEIVDNGLQALERAKESPPRLILLDMMMPVMDGYEAATRFCEDPQFDGIPIIALTAKAMKGDLEKTLEAGCDDYLAKPVSRQVLLDKVAEWLARSPAECRENRQAKRRSGAA